jgi:hypothetical protein
MTSPNARYTHTVFAMLMTCAGLAFAQAPSNEPPGPDRWPTTVRDTVKDILSSMPEADRERLKTMDKKDLILLHHSWGMGIRNHYGLWGGNTKLLESACGKACHPDNASGIIMAAVWDELHK